MPFVKIHIFEKVLNSRLSSIENMTRIPEECLGKLLQLRQVVLPKSVNIISEKAFFYCPMLESVNIPNVTSIENWAFGYCFNLKKLDFGDNIKYIAERAFQSTGIEEIDLSNAAHLNAASFPYMYELKKLILPMTYRGNLSLVGCRNIQVLKLGNVNWCKLSYGSATRGTKVKEFRCASYSARSLNDSELPDFFPDTVMGEMCAFGNESARLTIPALPPV
jgi:hypothetical protein